VGPDGVRSIWRLGVAVALYVLIEKVLEIALVGNSAVLAWMRSQPRGVLSPGTLLFTEGIRTAAALLAGLAMSKVEDRSFAEYGFPWREAFGRRFWQGGAFGFAMLTLLMASIAVAGGFSLGGAALGAGEAARCGTLYALGFLLVGFFEEGTFRGYMQSTLGSGIGFWPAALALSVWFGILHVRNPGEAMGGVLMVGGFGLLAAFSVRRTGNVWFALGMHAAWDWGESYLYGVSNSGMGAVGRLMSSSLHGPGWITGGTVGPEGSIFVFAVMAAAAVALHYAFPAKPKTP
jgi:membrane protease YdiL (CAAX protease family)